MVKRITKATAKAAVRKHAGHLTRLIEIGGDCVAIFRENLEGDTADYETVEAAARAISKDCGDAPYSITTGAAFVYYGRTPATFGHDWNDRCSPHHY